MKVDQLGVGFAAGIAIILMLGGAAAVTIIRLAASVDGHGSGRSSAPSGRWQPPFKRGPGQEQSGPGPGMS